MLYRQNQALQKNLYSFREIVKELFEFHSSGQFTYLAQMKCQQNLDMEDLKTRTKPEIQHDFPKLKLDEFIITSRINFCYNCFAWAAGYDTLNMQPSTNEMYGWLTGEIGETLDNFEKQFQLLGFERADNDDWEEGIEKAAFYVKDNIVEHASRQLENGWWASKLGPWEDIEYKMLNGLEGDEYGQVKMIMMRPLKDRTQIRVEERVSENAFVNFKNTIKNIVNVPKKEIDEQLKLERENKQKNRKRK